ncbi:hypothetical protein SAMN03080598_00737 [Algoriphagus boritolerans DSM 17298 = JCM 18970]|uniref:Uncharacterized protein n=2 Tax=Algoriphagus TaxID=246875 RepID=A0A1H5TG61_9BACT|nr:hypothetical protein SAMN03080598_00737 [Algoriphagus boritolerans DSM 17298 = JCM 18970]
MLFLSILFLSSCGMESIIDMEPNQLLDESVSATFLNSNLEGKTVIGQDALNPETLNEEKRQVTDQYQLLGTAANGLATGFILKEGLPVTLTASGLVGFYFAGLGDPATPNGRPELGPTNGFPLISLIAKVGDGPLQLIGSGPTQLVGSGELVLFVNDNFFGDNVGSWTVDVSYECFPGYGFGDQNHYHCK